MATPNLRDMGTGQFRVYYYDIDDLTTPISGTSHLTFGPNIELEFPELTLNRPFVFFKAFRSNSTFMAPVEDPEIEAEKEREALLLDTEEREKSAPYFQLYPNPNEGHFVFTFTDCALPGELVIYTTLSEELYRTEINSPRYEINLGTVANGTYMVEFTSGEKVFRSKLIVNR